MKTPSFLKHIVAPLFLIFIITSCTNDLTEAPTVDAKIIVSPEQLSLEKAKPSKISLSVLPSATVEWSIASKPEWVRISPSSGTLTDGIAEIEVEADLTGLYEGNYSGTIEITTNGVGTANLHIDLNLGSVPVSNLDISMPSLEFDYFEDEKNFYVKNNGDFTYEWKIRNENPELTFEPSSGNLAIGDSVAVNAAIDRSSLETEIYGYGVTVEYGVSQVVELPVSIKSYKEDTWQFNGDIVDAEFDRTNDRLIAVSMFPDQIRKFDISSETVQTLDLNLPPTSVSVDQDGNFAAVGHNGRISYIDLNAMELVKMYDVTTDVLDIVLAPNNWVYAFPREDQWERIRCIDLSTGNEMLNTGGQIYAGTVARLHPSGNFIYATDNGISPSDIEKYDITNGTADYLYDSPYHGDFAIDGNLWFSESGDQLFTRGRNVFNATTAPTVDLTYDGALIGEDRITTMDYHSDANRVYAVLEAGEVYDKEPSSILRKYNADYLTFRNEVALPKVLGQSTDGSPKVFDAQGHFGFFNEAGTKFYILLRAPDEANIQNKWSIATVIVD